MHSRVNPHLNDNNNIGGCVVWVSKKEVVLHDLHGQYVRCVRVPCVEHYAQTGHWFSPTWWSRWPDSPIENEYPQWTTLSHHHPQCSTLDTPQLLHPMITHLWEMSYPHMGAQCFMWNISHNHPIHTTMFTHNHNKGVTGGFPWDTKHTHEKGDNKGHSPWANPGKKKDNKLFFSSIIFYPKKRGVSRGRIPPWINVNKKVSPCIYLIASPCISLPLFAFALFVSDCMFVVFVQPTQPPTYTIQPPTYTTTTQWNLHNKANKWIIRIIHWGVNPLHQNYPPFHSIEFWFHGLMQSQFLQVHWGTTWTHTELNIGNI